MDGHAPGEKRSESRPRLSVVGAPSSAGAYAPGQERAPTALRAAGLLERLRDVGIDVHDLGDTESFRWLTVCELNPDHGLSDGSTLRTFVAALSNAIAPKHGPQGSAQDAKTCDR